MTKEGARKQKNNRKLNVHYYEALKRALYKPAAFFKGIVFPLLQVSMALSVVRRKLTRDAERMHTPRSRHHCLCIVQGQGASLTFLSRPRSTSKHGILRYLYFCDSALCCGAEPFAGPNSLFIRILLDKKYALPFKVVDALVFHFIRLSNTYKAKLGGAEKLPVLWHQSLLVFCQRSVPHFLFLFSSNLADRFVQILVRPHTRPEGRIARRHTGEPASADHPRG